MGVTPDEVTYSTIMCTCNEAGQYTQTIALYKQMVAKGVRVNDVAARRGIGTLDFLCNSNALILIVSALCVHFAASRFLFFAFVRKNAASRRDSSLPPGSLGGLLLTSPCLARPTVVTAHRSLGGTLATGQLIHVFPSGLSSTRESSPAVPTDALPIQPHGKATSHAERVRAALVARGALAHELHESHRGLASRLAMPAMHMNALLISTAEPCTEQSNECAAEPVSPIQLAPVMEPAASEYRTMLNACRHNLQVRGTTVEVACAHADIGKPWTLYTANRG